MIKEKPCKPHGKAKGYNDACGKITPVSRLNYGLCPRCYPDFIMNTEPGQIIYRKRIIPKANKLTEQNKKQEKKATVLKLKTIPEWKKQLQDEINLIARLIDKDCDCISCQKPPKKKNGGHYRSVGSNPSLRFNLFNIYMQCNPCNDNKGGNNIAYTEGIILIYGKAHYEYLFFELPQLYPLLKIPKEEYADLLKKARAIVRELKAKDAVYTPAERIELRQKYNAELGIY